MRCVKSKNEIAMIQRACDITSQGFDAVLRTLKPGMNEFGVQETIEFPLPKGLGDKSMAEVSSSRS